MKRLCLTLALLLIAASALAADPQLEDRGLDLGIHSVHWPELTGLADTSLQEEINALLRTAADAEALTGRLGLVFTSPVPLKADWSGWISGSILCCAAHAEGPLTTGRSEERWGTAVIDLESGASIPLSAFLLHGEEDLPLLEELLEEEYSPELSAHLAAAEVSPLPGTYTADAAGLTLYYPASQLTYLSGKAGTVRLYWNELFGLADLEENSPAARLGAAGSLLLRPDSASALLEEASEGALSLWPVRLGGSLAEAISAYGRLSDPDLYLGGRYYEFQDDRFRGVKLMTDALTDTVDASTFITGIRADRFCLYGLYPGRTRDDVLEALGQPDASVTLDSDQAEALRLPPGQSDYYLCPPYRLRLHYDSEGILASLFLTE